MASKVFSVRFPMDTIARIKSKAGARGRNAFILSVVEDALGSGPIEPAPAPKPARKAVKPKARQPISIKPGSSLSADKSLLLTLYLNKPIASRSAKQTMGWLGLRYENAERGLISDGLIRVIGGMVHSQG